MADLERVCDYLVVLVASRVRVTGTVRELLAAQPVGAPASLEDLVLGYLAVRP